MSGGEVNEAGPPDFQTLEDWEHALTHVSLQHTAQGMPYVDPWGRGVHALGCSWRDAGTG